MKTYSSLQEVYDTAVAGLASQGFRQSKERSMCRYRSADGPRCAIGWCIPDDVYTPGMEGKSIVALLRKSERSPGLEQLFKGISHSALDELQLCHDDIIVRYEGTDAASESKNPEEQISDNLRNFAAKWNLQVHTALQ